MIKRAYEGMATRLRADTHAHHSTAAECTAEVAEHEQSPQPEQSAQGSAMGEVDAPQCEGNVVAEEESKREESKPKGLEKYEKRVMSGALISRESVSSTGGKILAEYLRAMGAQVTRSDQKDVELLRERMMHELERRDVQSWCVQHDDDCATYLAKKQKRM